VASYEKALDCYQQAYAIRGSWYPGINVATLLFVLGKIDQARRTAEAVLRSLEGPTRPEELFWVRATQGDAHLLLGNDVEAENFYRQAVTQSDNAVGYRTRAAMRRQFELLLAFAPSGSAMIDYWTRAKRDEVFGA
jgi:hypothetical protein